MNLRIAGGRLPFLIGLLFLVLAQTTDADDDTSGAQIPPQAAAAEGGPAVISLGPDAQWIRRDWSHCGNQASWRAEGNVAVVSTDTSAVLYWLIPSRLGGRLELPPGQAWLRQCDRPSLELWQQVRERDQRERCLADPYETGTLAWAWRLEQRGQGDPHDGRVVSVGVTLPRRGAQQIRELVYVWSRRDSVGAVTVAEQTIVPMVLKQRSAEIVVRQGLDEASAWQGVRRDLVADYGRAFPGERPGKLLRVYVKINEGRRREGVDAHVAHLRLERDPGAGRPGEGSRGPHEARMPGPGGSP